MKLDVVQLFRAADELARYLYSQGARKIQVSWDFAPTRSFCALFAPELVLDSRERERLDRIFSGPIQPEIASYYGGLAGRRRDEPELELLGTMTELEELFSQEDTGTRIVISRREAEYFGT
jgi:hypothetical protein